MRLSPPWRVRLTDPDDVAKYGDRWWIYDEAALFRLPIPELLAIEAQIPMPLKAAMDANRDDRILGELITLWVAIRLAADPEHPCPPFADFQPLIMLAEWELVPAGESEPAVPLDEGPPSSESSETSG